MQRITPFQLMNWVFYGLLASLSYGLLSFCVLFFLEGKLIAQSFLVNYMTSFNTLISLGLILGTALLVFKSQDIIPSTIHAAFTDGQLNVQYKCYLSRFSDRSRSFKFAIEFALIGLIIFYFCQFPPPSSARVLMIIPACAQYAFGVYVGRKLFYAGMMLHSLLAAPVTKNLFKERKLDDINTYVHVVSTLTIIFGYVHLKAYSEGPFLFNSVFGKGIKTLLLLPALIGTPVLLIFNFYSRAMLRRLYDRSIDYEISQLRTTLQNEQLSIFEKKSYELEFDRMSREELRYRLQLTLSDLPIGITIIVMALESLLGK